MKARCSKFALRNIKNNLWLGELRSLTSVWLEVWEVRGAEEVEDMDEVEAEVDEMEDVIRINDAIMVRGIMTMGRETNLLMDHLEATGQEGLRIL
jgi:hypothetical protein